MANPFDPEELLVCPYDPVHKVARKRMQIHLVKCRKVGGNFLIMCKVGVIGLKMISYLPETTNNSFLVLFLNASLCTVMVEIPRD